MSAPFEPTNTANVGVGQKAALGLRVANMRKAYADEVAHQLRGWVGKDADRQTAAAALDTWVRRHALDDDLRGMVLTNFDPRREPVGGKDYLPIDERPCEFGCIDGWASAQCPVHGVKAYLADVFAAESSVDPADREMVDVQLPDDLSVVA